MADTHSIFGLQMELFSKIYLQHRLEVQIEWWVLHPFFLALAHDRLNFNCLGQDRYLNISSFDKYH